jgi:hypothetical protein
MRLLKSAALLVLIGLLTGGCYTFFTATAEEPLNPVFKPYTQAYVSWIAFPEGDWQTYGYPTQAEWVGQIEAYNTKGIQKYLKDWIPALQVSGDTAAGQAMPEAGELYIKLTYKQLVPGGGQGGSDNLLLDVEFIDLGTKQTVYKAAVEANSLGTFPRNWGASTFDGRLDNEVYNLAEWIKIRLGR